MRGSGRAGGWPPDADEGLLTDPWGKPKARLTVKDTRRPQSSIGTLPWRGFARVHRRTLVIACALLVLWPSALAATWTQIDTDLDGLSASEEKRFGTDPMDGDSDGDGLEDGWELFQDLDPLSRDSDGDTVDDLAELEMSASPLDTDSDGDSIPDREEAALSDTNCDGDGRAAIADADDDGDYLPDADERPETRCRADHDEDGVLDGFELDMLCVSLPDCDHDGLGDADEEPLGFDALKSDTYGMGIPDGVVYALNELGLDRSADEDQDGIPDGWETNNTVFPWHEFDPRPGQKDLLIEFVKVTTPATGRYENILDFTPAYTKAVEALQRNGSISVHWVETHITLSEHESPLIIPSIEGRHYADLLPRTKFGTHPYVTTIVMNPEHDQAVAAHFGIAQIRGMLAAVDYGAHMLLEFRGYESHYDYWCECYQTTTKELTLSPILEALIKGGRDDLLASLGFYSSSVTGDTYRLGDWSDTFEWSGPWFKLGKVHEKDGITYSFYRATLDLEELADTILHELGHTLGLCHLDLEECLEEFPANEALQTHRSTMDPDRPGPTFDFLPTEWKKIDRFLACPPHLVLQTISHNASKQDVVIAKYRYDIETSDEFTGRSCGEVLRREGGLEPQEGGTVVSAMGFLVREPPNPHPWLGPAYVYWLPIIGILSIIGWAALRIRKDSSMVEPSTDRLLEEST